MSVCTPNSPGALLACPLFYDDCSSFNLADKLMIATLCGPTKRRKMRLTSPQSFNQPHYVTFQAGFLHTVTYPMNRFLLFSRLTTPSDHRTFFVETSGIWLLLRFLSGLLIISQVFPVADASFFLPLSNRKSNDSQGQPGRQRESNKKSNKGRKEDERLRDTSLLAKMTAWFFARYLDIKS